jgi:dienelactone hydrolase
MDLAQPEGIIREAASIPFVTAAADTLHLDAIITRPANPGRYPVVLLNHGTPATVAEAANVVPTMFTSIAIDFARRGWVAASMTRRGHGRSEGKFSDGYGSCENANYQAAGIATAQDVIQSIQFLQSQPYVDPTRVLLVGVSGGGFGSVAAASLAPVGLVGVINFAGGRGHGSNVAGVVCSRDHLIAAYGFFGRTVSVPTLWIYSENDNFFGPALARDMFSAFVKAGGRGELIIAPPYGQDGHGLILGPAELWQDYVDGFLRVNALPTWFRPLERRPPILPAPPGAKGNMERDFRLYLASENYEKAFAIGPDGHYGWATRRRSPEEAVAAAVEFCGRSGATCRPYAINDLLQQ